ncbi:tight adherence protein B [Rhodococcus sp. PvR044]|nr:type II secretion system protein F (GspF) [Rhodococcus sp. OK611]SNX92408.1 type II secretion system protein F (GspF) [Rhodococcus sp. OK270]
MVIAALTVAELALVVAPTTRTMTRLSPPRRGAGLRGHARLWAAVVLGSIAAVMIYAPTAGCAGAALTLTTAYRRARRRREGTRNAELCGLLGCLEAATGELRVGAHPANACTTAARESSGAAADAFRAAAARARLGGSAADGLQGAGSAIDAELARVSAAWRVADRYGVALADLLDAVRADLVGRIRFRDRVEAGLSGARATAAVLACLPLLGIALGQLMGASPLRVLLSGGLGGTLLVLGTLFVCAGLLWTDRITGRVTR